MAIRGATVGQRDKLVTIQQKAATDAAEANGFPVDSWSTLVTAWMRKGDVSQAERFNGAQVSSPVDTEWEMPYLASMDPYLVDVTKLRRLVYRSRLFDITRASVRQFEDGQAIVLTTLARSGIES